MITTITLNPAIDRTMILDTLQCGSVNRIKSVREDIGGKGINVSKVLSSLGHSSCAIGFIGEENKDYVEGLLAEEGLTRDFIRVGGQTRLNTKIVELDTRITTDLNEIGFEVTTHQLGDLKKLIVKYAKKSQLLVFSGSIPKGLGSNIYFELLSLANQFTKTALDADGHCLLEGLKASPYIIKPNIHELENALSRKLDTHQEIKAAAVELTSKYNIKYVLVSMGEEGSILVSAKEAFFAKALKVDVKSSVGAGDSMVAGFIYGISRGLSTCKALAYATVCGGLAASQAGSQSFKRREVEVLLAKVEIVTLD